MGAPQSKSDRMLHRGVVVVRKRESGGSAQPKASATRLEQRRTKPPAVNARNPSDTRSCLRMGHLAALVFDARSDRLRLSERAVLKEVMLAVRANALRPSCGNLQTHGPGRSPRLPDPSVPKPSRSSLNSKSRPCMRENACGLAQSKEFQ